MRASELEESAADELKRKLPSLSKTDYSTIDHLMKRISKRFNISGKKLHDLFVSKYGETPDHWIKKYKNKLDEGVESSDDEQKIKDFIEWSYKKVNLQKPYPKFTFSRNTEEAQEGHHTGRHTHDGENSQIWVYIENRNLVDIFRTIFHEIVHERQMQLDMIGPDDSYPGSPVEAMADMMAGKYIKIYGKEHPEIFQ
jgi:hypothetical protein